MIPYIPKMTFPYTKSVSRKLQNKFEVYNLKFDKIDKWRF